MKSERKYSSFAESWADRVLGRYDMVTLPNRAIWFMTGNNTRTSMEIARRCVRIRINLYVDRPWLRQRFKHPSGGEVPVTLENIVG